MGQITIRGIDPQIESIIRQRARESGKSLNRVILDMIYAYTGHDSKRKPRPCASLKKLAGGWNKQDADGFFESIKPCEQIDEDMWV